MAKMIQVRNVPDRLHSELSRRARLHGQSLTDFVEAILEREVSLPPQAEVLDRIESREPVELDVPIAELIRAERREAGRDL